MAFITIEIVDDEYTVTEGVTVYKESIGAGYHLLTAVGKHDKVVSFLQRNADMGEDVTWICSQIQPDSAMDEHNVARPAIGL